MRILAVLVFMASAAWAADWSSYVNPRFGFAVEIPPGFAQSGAAAENGDGLAFKSVADEAELLVWGSNVVDGTFKDEMDRRIQWAKDDGWTVTYISYDKQKVLTWAAFSGVKGDRIFYERALSSCKATQAVMFRFEYPDERKKIFDKIIGRTGKSFRTAVEKDCP